MTLEGVGLVASLIVALGVFVAALGYTVGKFHTSRRTGETEVEDRVMKLIKDERDTLERKVQEAKEERERVATALRAEVKEKDRELAVLQGKVQQLSSEAAELRKLVMGEKVPSALASEIAIHHEVTREHFNQQLSEFQTHILEAMLALGNDFRDALSEFYGPDVRKAQIANGIDNRIRRPNNDDDEMGV